jgi:cation/acetate symporter
MSTEILTIISIVISFAIYFYVGYRSRVRDTQGFYVAGQSISAFANGAATAAGWISAASFVSMTGLVSFLGYDGTIYLMGWTGGYVLLALLFAPYLRKFGRYTIPDFVGDRYYSLIGRVAAAVATIVISLTYVAGQMRGVGIILSRYLQVDINIGIIIAMVIIAYFAAVGGMKGITWTQVIQYFILIIAFMIPAILLSYKLTGNPVPQLALTFSDVPQKLNTLQVELGLKEYLAPFQNLSRMNVLAITMVLMAGTAGLPHVLIRFYTAANVRAARYTVVWALFFTALLYTASPAVSVFAKYNLIQGLHNQDIQEVREIDWVNKWESTGLLQLNDLDGDGKLSITPYEDTNEVIIDKDIIVLAAPEVAKMAPLVIALVAVGGIAAALSTASGLLLAMSSAVSHDIYFGVLKPGATDMERLKVGRSIMLLSVVVAGYFGMHPPGFVGEVVTFAFGLAAASLFPVILLGIFDTRMNREGAVSGLITGFAFTIIMIILMQSVQILGTQQPILKSFLGINALGIGIVGMLLNFLVAFLVSRVTAPPPLEIQNLIEDFRSPE